MAFPDTEERALEVEKAAPLTAARLRQYATLSRTQEATIEEMRATIAALNAALAAANARLGEYSEQVRTWRELPDVKARLIAEAQERKASAEADLVQLGVTVEAVPVEFGAHE